MTEVGTLCVNLSAKSACSRVQYSGRESTADGTLCTESVSKECLFPDLSGQEATEVGKLCSCQLKECPYLSSAIP